MELRTPSPYSKTRNRHRPRHRTRHPQPCTPRPHLPCLPHLSACHRCSSCSPFGCGQHALSWGTVAQRGELGLLHSNHAHNRTTGGSEYDSVSRHRGRSPPASPALQPMVRQRWIRNPRRRRRGPHQRRSDTAAAPSGALAHGAGRDGPLGVPSGVPSHNDRDQTTTDSAAPAADVTTVTATTATEDTASCPASARHDDDSGQEGEGMALDSVTIMAGDDAGARSGVGELGSSQAVHLRQASAGVGLSEVTAGSARQGDPLTESREVDMETMTPGRHRAARPGGRRGRHSKGGKKH